MILRDNTINQAHLLCISHLRWDFVYQRPQHLLSRIAKERNATYFEEPQFTSVSAPTLELSRPLAGLTRAVPLLPHDLESGGKHEAQAQLLQEYLQDRDISRYDIWYYTPMGLKLTGELRPERVIFDCMDELSGFLGAPVELRELERRLLHQADVVFTGGASLFEVKRFQHNNVHCCPSSIDRHHFARACDEIAEPTDQQAIPHPRVGFYGVVDERFDTELLRQLAHLRPDLHFVIIGPVVKIDPKDLPQAANIHYLGRRNYDDLPAYLSGWDVAILPFARNDATRFISPTKTPEYLAAGRPVVSTSIQDVVKPYGERGLVSIADSAEQFSKAIDFELQRRDDPLWKKEVDGLLSQTSWDATWRYMATAIQAVS